MEIQLAKPGAGLPWIENLVARYWLLPRFWRKTSWDQAQAMFDYECDKLLTIARGLSTEQLGQRVLVDRLPGIEDSSRHWSVAMCMEHLMIVSDLMARLIESLDGGVVPTEEADVAKVKPPGLLKPEEACARFAEFAAQFRERMERIRNRNSALTFSHPWFGAMTMHQWHCLAALHHRTHRKQAEAIVKGLSR